MASSTLLVIPGRQLFASNPRLALLPRALDRLDSGRRADVFSAAEQFLAQHTSTDRDEQTDLIRD